LTSFQIPLVPKKKQVLFSEHLPGHCTKVL
jgi:hypothetical protein